MEIYSQVEWTACQAITVKWILLHLFVTLILEIWFSLDECQMELRPSFILCVTARCLSRATSFPTAAGPFTCFGTTKQPSQV